MSFQVIDLLDSNDYQTYNRSIARELKSINAAIMLSDLINRYKFHRDRKELKTFSKYDGVWFYYTIEKCEERTVLSRKEQTGALKKIAKYKFFTKKIIGVPGKRHFQINIKELEEFISGSKKHSKMDKTDKLGCPKGTNCDVPKGQTIKEPYKEPYKEKKGRNSVAPSKHSFRLVSIFFESLKKNNPHVKEPNHEKWALSIDRMHRVDGYSYDEIEALIKFSQENEFWSGNIECPDKLRKQAHKLTVQMKNSRNKESSEEYDVMKELDKILKQQQK